MPDADLIALDIGGANLKAADGLGWTEARPFALWREWRRLPDALAAMLSPHGPRRVVAAMTGEIADCYPTRAAGVTHIVRSLVEAAATAGCPEPPGIYLVDGRIVPAPAALAEPGSAAAANWHAVTRLAASLAADAAGFLVDAGSTTTDIVPFAGGRPTPVACDDAGRMASGELVYTGMERTPVAALVRTLPHRGTRRPVAAERFAESRDAWLLLGGLPEDVHARDTADGAAATRDAARVRLARMLLVDPGEFDLDDATLAATRLAAVQARLVAGGLVRVARHRGWRPRVVVIAGHGEPLVRLALARVGWDAPVISLPASLGADVSRAAPAHALARIARGLLA